jgi:hypothetical protein
MNPQIYDKTETINGVVNTSKAKQAAYREAKKRGMTCKEYREFLAYKCFDCSVTLTGKTHRTGIVNGELVDICNDCSPLHPDARITPEAAAKFLQPNPAKVTPAPVKPKSATAIKRAVRFYVGMTEELFSLKEDMWTKEDPYTRLLTLHGGDGRYPWKTPTKGYMLPPTEAEFDAEYDAAMKDFDALMAQPTPTVTPEPKRNERSEQAILNSNVKAAKRMARNYGRTLNADEYRLSMDRLDALVKTNETVKANPDLFARQLADARMRMEQVIRERGSKVTPDPPDDQPGYRQLANPHTCPHNGEWAMRKVGNANGRAMRGRPRLPQRTCLLCGASEGVIDKIARKATVTPDPALEFAKEYLASHPNFLVEVDAAQEREATVTPEPVTEEKIND